MDWSPLYISIKTAAVSIIITFFLGIYLARWATRLKSGKLRLVVDGVLTLPLVLPPTVVGFFLLFIFGVKRPVGQFLLQTMGVKIVFTWWATVIAAVVISLPLMYRSARGAFDQVDQNLLYAGRTLGMSERRIFWRVLMPAALPGVAAGGILAFARGLGEFGATAMLAGNIAGKTMTLPLAVYSEVAAGDMEGAYQYVGVILLLSFGAILLMNYFTLREGRGSKRRRIK